jgi:hypothetical protein
MKSLFFEGRTEGGEDGRTWKLSRGGRGKRRDRKSGIQTANTLVAGQGSHGPVPRVPLNDLQHQPQAAAQPNGKFATLEDVEGRHILGTLQEASNECAITVAKSRPRGDYPDALQRVSRREAE